MSQLLQKISLFLQALLLKSKHYRWHVFTPRVSRETIAPLIADYNICAAGGNFRQRTTDGRWSCVSRPTLKQRAALPTKRIVYLCDGRTVAGGLADRFKGILSVYAICREQGYDFRMLYTSPFTLDRFLAPADHDWRIRREELNTSEAAMIVLETTDDSPYQTRHQEQWLRKRFAEGPAEMHVITNSNYAYTLDYAQLFWELFRPSPELSAALEAEKQRLGRYISISARFLSQLGDFRETGGNDVLPDDEAQRLIERNLQQIQLLHNQHPDHFVLVNSDSMRFLRAAEALPFVKVVEGRVEHTDLMTNENTGNVHMKLFLDFLLIASAESIFLLHTPPMRISGFPYAASLLHATPFSIVRF